MNKRGSLALSTNAIVVLIIAITILGLSLAFTRNIFGSLGDQVSAIGEGTKLENPPDYDDPLTLSKSQVEVRLGRNVKLDVGFYNKYDGVVTADLEVDGCSKGADDTISQFEFTIPRGKEIPVNNDIRYSIIIQTDSDLTEVGTHVCSFKVDTGDEVLYEDLYVEVV